jgi:hypothetical protein
MRNAAPVPKAVAACLALVLSTAHKAGADPAPVPPGGDKMLFALIVGVNRSVDADLAPLVYADDDAVRYRELFRTLGARTYLLTRPDANTRQVFPEAVADAREPRASELWRASGSLSDDIAQAHRAGAKAALYVVYAGHGGVDEDGRAYITLEDARIGGEELGRRLVDAPAADQTHIIVDACYSYYLAYERGPGGKRREAHGFTDFRGLAARKNVGLLLSTSSARESHEWEGFQAGVFSHEIRSGLYGAADADRDGYVSYREIAAFVMRANQAIPNERFRPDVFARPPPGGSELVDLHAALARKLSIDREARAGHYYLEDERGNRLADFHNAPGQALELVRPAQSSAAYLHRVADDREFRLPPTPEHLLLSQLEASSSSSHARGAAHHAFSLLFSLPFDEQAVRDYSFSSGSMPAPDSTRAREPRNDGKARTIAGVAGLGVATIATGLGVAFSLRARALAAEADNANQMRAAQLNEEIHSRNVAAGVSFGVAGAAAIVGAVLWFWPEKAARPSVAVAPGGGFLGVSGRF